MDLSFALYTLTFTSCLFTHTGSSFAPLSSLPQSSHIHTHTRTHTLLHCLFQHRFLVFTFFIVFFFSGSDLDRFLDHSSRMVVFLVFLVLRTRHMIMVLSMVFCVWIASWMDRISGSHHLSFFFFCASLRLHLMDRLRASFAHLRYTHLTRFTHHLRRLHTALRFTLCLVLGPHAPGSPLFARCTLGSRTSLGSRSRPHTSFSSLSPSPRAGSRSDLIIYGSFSQRMVHSLVLPGSSLAGSLRFIVTRITWIAWLPFASHISAFTHLPLCITPFARFLSCTPHTHTAHHLFTRCVYHALYSPLHIFSPLVLFALVARLRRFLVLWIGLNGHSLADPLSWSLDTLWILSGSFISAFSSWFYSPAPFWISFTRLRSRIFGSLTFCAHSASFAHTGSLAFSLRTLSLDHSLFSRFSLDHRALDRARATHGSGSFFALSSCLTGWIASRGSFAVFAWITASHGSRTGLHHLLDQVRSGFAVYRCVGSRTFSLFALVLHALVHAYARSHVYPLTFTFAA